jgi:D-glycero-alpha-D-manno-heptose-7-phosphate kinase
MIVRAKAPLRVSFCGGGTDVTPYPEEKGGCVLSTTIDRYAWASVSTLSEDRFNIHSQDYSISRSYPNAPLTYDGELDLAKGVLNHFQSHWADRSGGLDVFTHSDAPPGSGLGSSSTMVATLVGAVAEWLQVPLSNYDIAETTYKIERLDIKLSGGRQDQYAAVFGGFNFIEFHPEHTIVNPLRISTDIRNELEYHLLMIFTGGIRTSAQIVDTQMSRYRGGEASAVSGLDQLKALAVALKDMLLQGRLNDFGTLLHEAWETKKRLADAITNSQIDGLYGTAREMGALGGKILGAGGGGHLLLYCPVDRKHAIAAEMERMGGRVVRFAFEDQGLQSWRVR